jgi:hypothetical protein
MPGKVVRHGYTRRSLLVSVERVILCSLTLPAIKSDSRYTCAEAGEAIETTSFVSSAASLDLSIPVF